MPLIRRLFYERKLSRKRLAVRRLIIIHACGARTYECKFFESALFRVQLKTECFISENCFLSLRTFLSPGVSHDPRIRTEQNERSIRSRTESTNPMYRSIYIHISRTRLSEPLWDFIDAVNFPPGIGRFRRRTLDRGLRDTFSRPERCNFLRFHLPPPRGITTSPVSALPSNSRQNLLFTASLRMSCKKTF